MWERKAERHRRIFDAVPLKSVSFCRGMNEEIRGQVFVFSAERRRSAKRFSRPTRVFSGSRFPMEMAMWDQLVGR
ncbi:hypothetical protein OUZ56_001077 [Daphnia magna]|uniref:Uncharacterized protein n=1 Tax=Daphnia magna TaxID=35525 RepID=A0ABR0A278_9CRUS|nr:hypothetical protein OUZ56_001077 [Daphnia magna]